MRKKAKKDATAKTWRAGFGEELREFLHRNLNWFLFLGLIFLIFQDIFGTHGVLAMRQSQKQAAEIRQEIERLNQENQRLQDRVKSLKTDPVAIEHILREERHLARPGEHVFEIPARNGSSSSPNTLPGNSPK